MFIYYICVLCKKSYHFVINNLQSFYLSRRRQTKLAREQFIKDDFITTKDKTEIHTENVWDALEVSNWK